MNIIGIDIGGSKIRGVLWNGARIVHGYEFSTPKNKKGFVKRLKTIVKQLSRGEADPIGIGVAGVIRGTSVIFSPNISYLKNFDFSAIGGKNTRVDNDARCFARGEYAFGAGKNSKSIFALTIGTGIGRAYGEKGMIRPIKKFEYPEKWEKEYQRIRDGRDNSRLVKFLGGKLAQPIRRLKPQTVIIGGGLLGRKGLFAALKKELGQHKIRAAIRQPRLKSNSAEIGAALLFKP